MKIRLLFLFLFTLQFPTILSAKVFTSVRNGCWDYAGTWDLNDIPSYTDTVVVKDSVSFGREIILRDNALIMILDSAELCGSRTVISPCMTKIINRGTFSCGSFEVYGWLENYGVINCVGKMRINICENFINQGIIHLSGSGQGCAISNCVAAYTNTLLYLEGNNEFLANFMIQEPTACQMFLYDISGRLLKKESVYYSTPDIYNYSFFIPDQISNQILVFCIVIGNEKMQKKFYKN